MIFSAFFMGAILGAMALKEAGHFTTMPIAIFLLLLAAPPMLRYISNLIH